MESINYSEYITYIVILIIAFILVYLPKKVQENKIREIQASVKVGDKVITYSGLFGKIVSIDGDKAILELEPDNIRVTIDRWSIAGIDE